MRYILQRLDDFHKDNEWKWLTHCQQAFDSIKGILNSGITHSDPSLEVIVAADTSQRGLDAVIQYRWLGESFKAIAYASSSLSRRNRTVVRLRRKVWH